MANILDHRLVLDRYGTLWLRQAILITVRIERLLTNCRPRCLQRRRHHAGLPRCTRPQRQDKPLIHHHSNLRRGLLLRRLGSFHYRRATRSEKDYPHWNDYYGGWMYLADERFQSRADDCG